MIRFILVLAVFVGFILGLIIFAPLSTVLKLSGAKDYGLSWSRAEGTLLSARVHGLAMDGDLIGDATLKLSPLSLAGLKLEYALQWSGPVGRGQGDAILGFGQHIEIQNYAVDVEFSKLKYAPAWVRQSSGLARLTGDKIKFQNGNCVTALGKSWSDALSRHEAILGAGWQELSGELSCDNGRLVIPFMSHNTLGTQLEATSRMNLNSPVEFEARISGFVPQEVAYALPYAGFIPDGKTYLYRLNRTPNGATQ